MRPTLCLLPSPLLGPAVWAPVASALSAAGWPVVETPPYPPGPAEAVLATLDAALPRDRELVLIPHSNASLYAPVLTRERNVTAMIFVDGRLPGAAGRISIASPAMVETLKDKVNDSADDVLPPWTQWWGDDIAQLFPSEEVRAAVDAQANRLPLSYFDGDLIVPAGWDEKPGAFLAFGDAYADDRRAAEARGWPVSTLAGQHLHMLIDPDGVARAILDLLGRAEAS